MYERYPISGIKHSYRPESETKTVVIPALIAALMIGMLTFYLKGKPPVGSVAVVETPKVSELAAPERASEATPVAAAVPPPLSQNTDVEIKATIVPEPKAETAGLPLLTRSDINDSDFTPWMSPLALDTYIRQKNRGFEQTFWERGHWIKAVEGRWENGGHEFRIAFASNPDPDRLQWYYRIDQTDAGFLEALDRLGNEGYTLVQSHAYDHPDGSKRFQGVWQREISDLAEADGRPEPTVPNRAPDPAVADRTPAPTNPNSARRVDGSRYGLRAFDVGNLNFR